MKSFLCFLGGYEFKYNILELKSKNLEIRIEGERFQWPILSLAQCWGIILLI